MHDGDSICDDYYYCTVVIGLKTRYPISHGLTAIGTYTGQWVNLRQLDN